MTSTQQERRSSQQTWVQRLLRGNSGGGVVDPDNHQELITRRSRRTQAVAAAVAVVAVVGGLGVIGASSGSAASPLSIEHHSKAKGPLSLITVAAEESLIQTVFRITLVW